MMGEAEARDFIGFSDNGNDMVIDVPGLVRALRSGADPNWLDPERNPGRPSTLCRLSEMISWLAEPGQTQSAFKLSRRWLPLVQKSSLRSQTILFFLQPISRGRTRYGRLLDMGADPVAWPNKAIGTNWTLSPVETAVMKGHQAIVELLVAHGASRPNERETLQLRFLNAASMDDAAEYSTNYSRRVRQ